MDSLAGLALTTLDVIVAGALLLGAVLGVLVGFIKGGLLLLSWAGSALATYYGFSTVRPYMHGLMDSPMLADLAAGLALFLSTLVILFMLSSLIGSWVSNSRLNSLDRSLGLLAGAGGTAMLICVGYLVFVWSEKEQPLWMAEARTLSLIQTGAALILTLAPDQLAHLEERARKGDAPTAEELLQRILSLRPEDDTKERDGYGKKERGEMKRLIETAE